MDRNGGRFGGGGHFSRGGRDGWQYRKKEDVRDRNKNFDIGDGKRGWSQNLSEGRFHEMQDPKQDLAQKERGLMGGVVVDKGDAARGTKVKQGRGSVMAGGPAQQSGGPDLAQQQQWLGALIAQLTQGNTLLGPEGDNVGGSSSAHHLIAGNQANTSNVNNVSREGQLRGWNSNPNTDGFDARVTHKGAQDREGGAYKTGQDLSNSGASGAAKVMCNKCKDTRHVTKDCKLGHCAICGKRIMLQMNVPG